MDSKLRILWILPGDPDSKVNMIFAKKTLPALEAAGLKIFIFHLTSRTNPISLLKLWFKAKQLINEQQPDVIHGQYGSIAGLFTCFLGGKTVITFRGSDVNGDPNINLVRTLFSKLASQLAAGFSDTSIYVSNQLRSKLLFPGRKAICLASPTNTKDFYPISKLSAREFLNLPLDEKIISFISSGGRGVKRPELARAVRDNLAAKGFNVRLLEITGVAPVDVPKWISASDCMLFTSLREGSPNAVREALACGVPTVSVSVGDVERWIKTDPFSRVSTTDSAEEMASLVEEVWDLAEPRIMRADLREVSLDSHIKTLISVYEGLVK